ncbi:putative disease resistance protein RGA4 [Iris pallida]|uniref:Disease resistance protein RGA4 n=1 Tax=Iris pallida TaxID=29817 RepID=A0AAX6DUE9_IRIPA|nr:putative disease resistance protein RGA4 [Iris pallida]
MATILSASVSVLGGALTALAKDEIIHLLGVQDETERFRWRLERMLSVLADAEGQQFRDRAVDCWLLQMRDVVYDAEDVVDECRIEGEKLRTTPGRRPPPSSSLPFAVRCFYSPFSCFRHYKFRHQIGDRIKSLNSKLDDIIKDIDALRLTPGTRNHYNLESSGVSRKTSPVAEPDVVGECIENDTKGLVDVLLLSSEHKTRQNVSVFAIVGMGGIGKTTLAQSIFNNKELKSNFSIKPIWVCVSQNFSEVDVLRAIIIRAGGSPGDARDREDLEPTLFSAVEGKKFFLVLDDVWDAQVWENLLSKPVQSGLPGSRVLVTTRNEAIAMRMGAVHCHRVEKMSDFQSWNFLRKLVFLDDDDEAQTQLALTDTGMRIVKKCDGLPLALKTVAGVLRTKHKTKFEWEKVLRNPAWSMTDLPEGPMGALYLSYQDLPPHLKQCFAYFALFPEDSKLDRSLFVLLWVAEGFIEQDGGSLLKEEIAEECWEELMRRSLLQYDPPHNLSCKIHDLLHSLARFLARNESFCGHKEAFDGEFSYNSSVATKPRRVHITQGGVAVSDVVNEQVFLRTLFLPNIQAIGKEDAFRKIKCLRILDLYKSSVEVIPDSIGNLVHLRFLRLTESQVRVIPESIGNLSNLLYLLLKNCRNLHSLPRSIVNLHNLRALTVSPTDAVQSIPSGTGKLQNLVTLGGFGVCSSNAISGGGGAVGAEEEEYFQPHQHKESGLYELSTLLQLITLHVFGLERASVAEARAAALKAKPHLIRIGFNCTQDGFEVESNAYYREDDVERIREVFEELCPPPQLETLAIRHYFGLEYPSWLMTVNSPYLSNLKILSLVNCALCEQLPPLGLLPHLYSLSIEGASAVKRIGPEFFLGGYSGSSARGGNVAMPYPSFPKLLRLYIINMLNLEEWVWLEEGEQQMTTLLPCLESFQLLSCPKLRSLPEGILCHATASTSLTIKGAHSLIEVKNLLSVKDLYLDDLPCLERVSNLPSLVQMWILGCENLQDIERLDVIENLELHIEMDCLPDWFLVSGGQELRFEALQCCVLKGNVQLLLRCLLDGPDWHKIVHIPTFHAYNRDGSAYISYTKSPFTIETNLSNDVVNNDDDERSSCSNYDHDNDGDNRDNDNRSSSNFDYEIDYEDRISFSSSNFDYGIDDENNDDNDTNYDEDSRNNTGNRGRSNADNNNNNNNDNENDDDTNDNRNYNRDGDDDSNDIHNQNND